MRIRRGRPARRHDDGGLLELDDGRPVNRIRNATNDSDIDFLARKPSPPPFSAFCLLPSAFWKLGSLQRNGNANGDELERSLGIGVSVPLLVHPLELPPQVIRIRPRLAVHRELERLPRVAKVIRRPDLRLRGRQLV